MELAAVNACFGPSLYSRLPVIRATVRWDDPDERCLAQPAPELVEGLNAVFPGLHLPPGPGEGNSPAWTDRGLDMARVTLDSILELYRAGGAEIEHADILSGESEEATELVYTYEDVSSGLEAAHLTARVISHFLSADPASIRSQSAGIIGDRERFLRFARGRAWQTDMRYLTREARRCGIPVQQFDRFSKIFGHGRNRHFMLWNLTDRTSHYAFALARSKPGTHQVLGDAGLPVPEQQLVYGPRAAIRASEEMGYPLVVKPARGDMGAGVTVGVKDKDGLAAAFDSAAAFDGGVVIESLIEGHDHRFLVMDGELVAVARRTPAHVTGDGRKTVAELVDQANCDPRRGAEHATELSLIEIDDEALGLIAAAGYERDSVLPEGETLYLRTMSNLSRGGTSEDVTDFVHPDNRDTALLAARLMELDIAGVDFILPDVGRSWREAGGAICEVNVTPGFRMHYSRDVAGKLFRMLFPQGTPAHIPIAAVTGTNGKTTTCRMLARILQRNGAVVGLTCSDGIYVGGEMIRRGDMAGPVQAQQILRDPRVEAAVLEVARAGLIRSGVGFDQCAVAAALNVSDEHLGFMGVETEQEMARVKGLVVELARDTAVLNADDPLCAGMAERSRAKHICYVTTEAANPLVRDHLASGGRAVVLEREGDESSIVLHADGERTPLLAARDLPSSFGGLALFNVQNAMFAAAMAGALGVKPAVIAEALLDFRPDHETNPGRLNVYDGHPFKVIMDYCHNRHGLEAVGRLVDAMQVEGRRICIFAMAGNRRDLDYELAAREAARHFDAFVICPPAAEYLRKRTAEEIMDRLTHGIRAAGTADDAVTAYQSRPEALLAAMDMARPGDLLYIMFDNYPEVWQEIVNYKPNRP